MPSVPIAATENSPSVVNPNRVAGSFRDPSGYVFEREGRVFRAIDGTCHAHLRHLTEKGLLAKWIESHMLVGTRFVEEPQNKSLQSEHPGYAHFLEHDRIAPITFPYEWTLSMLADAAILTLDLQIRLLSAGFSLKDATAYNIQFVKGRPIFIDLSSIERPGRLDLWFALGQFERIFLFPLLLCQHRGWDLRSYFLSSIHGRDLEQVSRSLGWFALCRPSLLLDVTLPLLLERKENKKQTHDRRVLHKPGTNSEPQLLNLKRLRSKIRKLASGFKPRGVWADYTSTCSYDQAAETAKKELVRDFLNSTRPRCVLDLGCNTGDYSFIAAESGAQVIAADGDPAAVELLYHRLKKDPRPISPVVLDLANPSPAIGYRNRERANFFDRAKSDCVLALALIHHLLVSANFSLAAIRDLFCDLTKEYLVLEFVPTNDPMFQRLMKFRVDLFKDLTLELCLQVFGQRFELIKQQPIAGSPRTLLFMRIT